ncbi:cytochrome c oxidase accessory protein CcoG [Colwellia sp. E2M01]|uniref:cytochrome c oxidase accessory protein CcoG n=1 Tax=Colwellia sp. E2M01 TaxID=2841561 RepID=UPI0020904B27|nr:cytochrome c oxidase accessory protein CcoG [Colwellia sp. E2M01]
MSNNNLIFKTAVTDDKIYIREQQGRFQKIRRLLSSLLMIIFVLTPFINYDGEQAILIDIGQQKIHIFAFTLFPQDLVIFCLFGIFSAFLLFYVTKIYGRVWCGFTCPQTIWMLMFNWVERRIEGSHNHSKALDKQPISLNKVTKKVLKHVIWGSISLFTALVFISYFIPVDELYYSFFTLKSSVIVFSWVLFFALCTYINAGWIREKMCLHMCPYARFQSAMFDQSTKLVSYDAVRGENRGKRKITAPKNANMGDCVDCNLCVQVCPVGIDIREGMQYECINCGLCVDACDMTMTKFNYPKGLIAFSATKSTKSPWKKHLSYGSCVTLSLVAMVVWGINWQSFEVNIIRDRQALYSVNQDGKIQNTYLFKIRNKSNQAKVYQINLVDFNNGHIVEDSKESHHKIAVQPQELKISAISVVVDDHQMKRRRDITFDVVEAASNSSITKNSSFYSGSGGW